MSRLVQIDLAICEQESLEENSILPNNIYEMLLNRNRSSFIPVSTIISVFGYSEDRRMYVWYRKFEKELSCALDLQSS